MLNKKSSTTVRNAQPIGEAISNGAGLYANNIMNTRDSMEREYGRTISSLILSVATLGTGALGAYGDGVLYMSKEYSSNSKLTEAMESASKSGFHPKLNGKTGAEAVASHEIGHYLGETASKKAGITEREIVYRAGKSIGMKGNRVASTISEYARYNYSETIAEAFADVYCNGKKASKASIAITDTVKGILR